MKDMSHFTPGEWATMGHEERMRAIEGAPFLFDDPDMDAVLAATFDNDTDAPLRCQGIEDDALGDDITDRLAAYDPDTSPGDVPGAALAEINRLRDALTAQAEMAAQAIEVALHYEGWFGDECRCGADDCPIVEWNK